MSHSNRGLNEPFYKWIDDVRRAMRKEKELQEKLEFYNMKLIGYKGVSYDRIGSSGSRSSGDSELMFWLDKINEVEYKMSFNQRILNQEIEFSSNLNDFEKNYYLNNLIQYDRQLTNHKNSELKKLRYTIVRKWFLFINDNL